MGSDSISYALIKMFTGIVEELGVVEKVYKKVNSARVTLKAQVILKDAKVGDSIAVNGVCLTVVGVYSKTISFDVMRETLNMTNLGHLKTADGVNLERAMKIGDRLGGHLVTGHIDGIGTIKNKVRERGNFRMEIGASSDIMRYIISKGSVAIDGVSLTVGNSADNFFTAYLIPHTLKVTTLGFKDIGDSVNIEVDYLGKYIEKFILERSKESKISKRFLKDQGFL